MINRVIIVGRLVRDPELRKTSTDKSVVAFTVALDNRVSGGEKTTSFIPCTAWNNTADNMAKFTRKGSLIGVDGHLNQRSYTANDGRKVSVVEVIADTVQFLEKRTDGNQQASSGQTSLVEEADSDPIEGIDGTVNDLPF